VLSAAPDRFFAPIKTGVKGLRGKGADNTISVLQDLAEKRGRVAHAFARARRYQLKAPCPSLVLRHSIAVIGGTDLCAITS